MDLLYTSIIELYNIYSIVYGLYRKYIKIVTPGYIDVVMSYVL